MLDNAFAVGFAVVEDLELGVAAGCEQKHRQPGPSSPDQGITAIMSDDTW